MLMDKSNPNSLPDKFLYMCITYYFKEIYLVADVVLCQCLPSLGTLAMASKLSLHYYSYQFIPFCKKISECAAIVLTEIEHSTPSQQSTLNHIYIYVHIYVFI